MDLLKLFAYCQLFITTICSEIVLPEQNSVEVLQECINEILGKYFVPHDTIILLNLDEKLKDVHLALNSTIIQTHYSKLLTTLRPIKANGYIITISEEIFNFTFESLSKTSQWNPRAKFIVITEGHASKLFQVVRKFHVFNVVLLKTSDTSIKIWSYFPFNFLLPEHERTKAVLVDTFFERQFQNDVILFPDKVPKNWANITLKVVLRNNSPYMMCCRCPDDEKQGIEMELIRMVQKILGFRIVYVNTPFDHWGSRHENGLYDGLYGLLQTYQADLAAGLFYANFTEVWDFDLSFSYMQDAVKWFVPAAKRQPPWRKIIRIFTIHMWVVLGLTLIIISLIVHFFTTLLPEKGRYCRFSVCLMDCFQCLIAESVQVFPKTTAVRIIIAGWVDFGLVMTSAFQSRLISALNFDLYEKQFSSTDEVIESKIKFGLVEPIKLLFSHTNSTQDVYIYQHASICPLNFTCLDRIAFQGDFATINIKRLFQYAVSKSYLGPQGRPLVNYIEENISPVLNCMAFSKGFPMVEAMNKLLMTLTQSGFILFLYEKVDYVSEKLQQKARKVALASNVLGLNEMYGVFQFLFVGWAIAGVAFVLERAVKLRKFGRFLVSKSKVRLQEMDEMCKKTQNRKMKNRRI